MLLQKIKAFLNWFKEVQNLKNYDVKVKEEVLLFNRT